jgi:hypothetical protein
MELPGPAALSCPLGLPGTSLEVPGVLSGVPGVLPGVPGVLPVVPDVLSELPAVLSELLGAPSELSSMFKGTSVEPSGASGLVAVLGRGPLAASS